MVAERPAVLGSSAAWAAALADAAVRLADDPLPALPVKTGPAIVKLREGEDKTWHI